MQGMLAAVANWCSIVSMVGLAATYRQIYKARKDAAEARDRSAWADMVKFVNVSDDVGVTIAPFKGMPFLPRIGERLTLPESEDGFKCGDYRVLDIHHVCHVDEGESCDARLMNVRVEVEPLQHAMNPKGGQ